MESTIFIILLLTCYCRVSLVTALLHCKCRLKVNLAFTTFCYHPSVWQLRTGFVLAMAAKPGWHENWTIICNFCNSRFWSLLPGRARKRGAIITRVDQIPSVCLDNGRHKRNMIGNRNWQTRRLTFLCESRYSAIFLPLNTEQLAEDLLKLLPEIDFKSSYKVILNYPCNEYCKPIL